MKKLLLYLLILLPLNVFAATANTSIIVNNYSECLWIQDKEISASGTGYFSYCMKAKCSNGVWQSSYLYNKNMLTCANGNTDYYTYIYKSSCSDYIGSCNSSGQVTSNYCGIIVGYDCNKTNNGSIYVPKTTTNWNPPTVKTSTTKTTTTKKTTTTRKPTTTKKTTTTKKPTTTTTTTRPKDSNNYLKELSITGYIIDFQKDVLSYEITIEREVQNVEVKYSPVSEYATATIENDKNIDINKPIIIRVVAEDGSTKEYTINLKYRVLSSNLNLTDITIKNYSFKFDNNKNSYDLIVKSEDSSLDITVVPEDQKTTYNFLGNKDLINGSKIKIELKSEDGQTKEYVINIIKEVIAKPKKSGGFIITLIILLILGVIGFIAFKFIKQLLPAKVDEKYDYE